MHLHIRQTLPQNPTLLSCNYYRAQPPAGKRSFLDQNSIVYTCYPTHRTSSAKHPKYHVCACKNIIPQPQSPPLTTTSYRQLEACKRLLQDAVVPKIITFRLYPRRCSGETCCTRLHGASLKFVCIRMMKEFPRSREVSLQSSA